MLKGPGLHLSIWVLPGPSRGFRRVLQGFELRTRPGWVRAELWSLVGLLVVGGLPSEGLHHGHGWFVKLLICCPALAMPQISDDYLHLASIALS